MTILFASLLTIGVLVFILSVRAKDLPQTAPVSPFEHLDERKASIYENLRDLQFEYRVGKLSDQDYQQSKQDLQKELANVLAEIDRLKQALETAVTRQRHAKSMRRAAPPGKRSRRSETSVPVVKPSSRLL